MEVESIIKLYTEQFGSTPEYLSRAPGRVNIIGEHIDYCGYGVLPIAIQNSITIVAGRNKTSELNIHNTEFHRYPAFSCKFSAASDISIDGVSWHNYLLCGIKGVLEHLPHTTEVTGVSMLVSGTIPPGAGLSSSSALVCCAALAVNATLKYGLSMQDLASTCAKSEHYIGTEGGGMDQAISLLATENKAMYIQFDPLRLEPVELPIGISFIVVNSCVESNKAVGNQFNTRVAECRVAAQLLAKLEGLEWREIRTLGQLQEILKLSLTEMISIVEARLHKEPFSREEILAILKTSEKDFIQMSLSAKTKDNISFSLYQRAKHVYSEASRVCRFKEVCKSSDVILLGALMTNSHNSCRYDYECSCKELDDICEISIKAGALGARLTGAGWGGCAVVMVKHEHAGEVMKQIRDQFFVGERTGKEEGMFVTVSSSGAIVLDLMNSHNLTSEEN
ncbi:N-acetylgalactosamine kinase isoform X1 [Oopsacas minuta]|uniref:N-acetylgalactosamine kinase isoform X1 n=1 Tax=Oopsacas minuta TaxID=111878 RepID=A0AAV7JL61_9METZ|nr:N-acetylgalactosamine kinase isoform X1 [Oopsacas minuta]